ncbi:MAG: CDP-alcohol phosphatidyltransferase family protein [Proteobacteria bacterium]|nr:CDP-alcohol phosphatidyltransferase family protein [Pseudomonadota bacterium]
MREGKHGEPIRRTSDIEEITNLYFIHPVSSRLTPLLADLHVSPNAVSFAGMAFGILAAISYYRYQDVRWVVAGFVLMILWHIMDGTDGQLARLTNSQSEFGKVIDGICDYTTFVAVYSALALALSVQFGGWIWILAISAGVCHAVQSAAYEVQRQEYEYWGMDRKSAALLALNAPLPDVPTAYFPTRVMHMLNRLYVGVQLRVAGVPAGFDEKMAACLKEEPAQAASLRARYRETFAPAVRRWSILSANYRTIGIFICAALSVPQYYFLFEIFGFSAILAILLSRQSARYKRFLRELETVK